MKKFKCKCDNGWKPTRKGSLVETPCLICGCKGWVNEETAIAYNISTKPKNEWKKDEQIQKT